MESTIAGACVWGSRAAGHSAIVFYVNFHTLPWGPTRINMLWGASGGGHCMMQLFYPARVDVWRGAGPEKILVLCGKSPPRRGAQIERFCGILFNSWMDFNEPCYRIIYTFSLYALVLKVMRLLLIKHVQKQWYIYLRLIFLYWSLKWYDHKNRYINSILHIFKLLFFTLLICFP